jgi:hypothetical protein
MSSATPRGGRQTRFTLVEMSGRESPDNLMPMVRDLREKVRTLQKENGRLAELTGSLYKQIGVLEAHKEACSTSSNDELRRLRAEVATLNQTIGAIKAAGLRAAGRSSEAAAAEAAAAVPVEAKWRFF